MYQLQYICFVGHVQVRDIMLDGCEHSGLQITESQVEAGSKLSYEDNNTWHNDQGRDSQDDTALLQYDSALTLVNGVCDSLHWC